MSLSGLGSTHHHQQQQQKNVLWKQQSPQEKSSQFLTVSLHSGRENCQHSRQSQGKSKTVAYSQPQKIK